MKKMLLSILALTLVASMSAVVMAESTALDAFFALTGSQQVVETAPRTPETILTDVMAGAYAAAPTETSAAALAAALPALTKITTRDMAAFASANHYTVEQVRHALYRALGNALRAEFQVRPATEEKAQQTQTVLTLFLAGRDAAVDTASRDAIRRSMTPDAAALIAQGYALPVDFVLSLIMDDQWDDDDWKNDHDWRDDVNWNDSPDDVKALQLGDKDSRTSTRVADLQTQLIKLGYLSGKADGVFGPKTQAALLQYQRANGFPATGAFGSTDMDRLLAQDVVARWDYDDSFDDSPEDNSPEDNSPDYNSPDYNTPDNSPDYNSPDYNTPDNSPDYNSPDYNTPDNSPDYNSPDYNTPDNSPDYNSPDYNSPDNSPDYNSPDDSPDYEDS